MRRSDLIAILLAFSAFPLGAAMMAAPDYLHLTGYSVALTFWGGIALASALLVAAAVVAWRGERESESSAVSPFSHAPRNVALIDAIWRIHLGRWDKRVSCDNEDHAEQDFFKITDEIRQLALDGKLPIWGRKKPGAPFEPIPLGFWKTHEIVSSYVMNHLVKDTFICVTEPTRVGQVRHSRTGDWSPDFMTSREVVEKLWPPREESS
jgi:hypothetical protein